MSDGCRQPGASMPTGDVAPERHLAAVWTRCPACRSLVYHRQLADNFNVCPTCEHHLPLRARAWIALLDDGAFEECDADLWPADPLGFTSPAGRYSERLLREQQRTGETDAVISGYARLDGVPFVLAVCDFSFLAGSMGSVFGEKIARAAERAAHHKLPLLTVNASGGARMQEGLLSLIQMAKTCAALTKLGHQHQLHISLLTDPCYGGVFASYASAADVVLAEPLARIGFAGKRVVAQTTGQALPEHSQTAELLLANGMIDHVVPRPKLRSLLRRLLRCARPGLPPDIAPLPVTPLPPAPPPVRLPDPLQRLQLARHLQRPRTLDYIRQLCTDFVELHGDRRFADDAAIVGGLARFQQRSVMVVGHQKGSNTRENIRRRFGMARPEGYRKVLRLFRLAEKLGLPLILFVDTPGASPDYESEARGQANAIAECIMALSDLRTPTVACVIGEGTSGGGLAMAMTDRLLMLEHATYTVVSPEGCAAILWRDASKAPEALYALRASAYDAYQFGIADQVVAEPAAGAHVDAAPLIAATGAAIAAHLDTLAGTAIDVLLERRYTRYRSAGMFKQPSPFAAEPALFNPPWEHVPTIGGGHHDAAGGL